MRSWPGALLALLVGATLPSRAADTPPWRLEATAGTELLSSGAPSWSDLEVSLRRSWTARRLAEGSLRRAERAGRVDLQWGALVALPLSARWSATLAAAVSPSHHFLPSASARAELAHAFDGGWVAQGGLSRRLYDPGSGAASGSSQWTLGGERYAGAWRWAAAWSRTRLNGGDTSGGARLQLDHYFAGERGRLGLVLARGRELEGVPAGTGVAADLLDQRVRSVAVVAAGPLARNMALTAELNRTRIDDVRRRSGAGGAPPARRDGLRLGVRHDF